MKIRFFVWPVFLFTFVLSLYEIIIFWKEPTNSEKYDLDYVLKDMPKSELQIMGDDIVIQGLIFPKETYRILYEDKLRNTVTIQFKNPDTSDADYVFPLKKADVEYLEKDSAGNLIKMRYKGREYSASNACIVSEAKDYLMVQMLQPPPGFRLKYDFRLSFGEIIAMLQILTVLIAVFVYFRESNREKSIARREIYQKLELASVDLFRFEFENAKKLWCFYSDFTEDRFPEKTSYEYWALQEYVCQIMNLFEMIVEFKKQKIIDTQVFLSWIQWFWDISNAQNFLPIWSDIRMNYTVPLRNAMDAGIAFARREKSDTKEQMGSERDSSDVMYEEFLRKIGQQFDCDVEIKVFLKKELNYRDRIKKLF